jgi:hypothetical protein
MFALAEIVHAGLTANSDWSWREAWLQEEGWQPSDHRMFSNPTDPTSRRLCMLAEAAQIGNRTQDYVEAPVRNVHGYFQRSMIPILDEVEPCMEMKDLDEEALEAVDELLDELEAGRF